MPGRLLIIEDDPAISRSLSRLLAREDYYVEMKESAEKAIARIEQDPAFDLILLDVALPGRDGFYCCRRLRQMGWRKPVLILTGRGQTHEKILGLECGADDYITKPFDPAELMARVRAHLRRTRDYNVSDEHAKKIVVGPEFTVDLKMRDAIVDGKPAGLTDREFELLALMARNLDTALEKNWLFEEIWGCTPDQGMKALAVYIRRLRQKVERDENNPRYIITVRGFGYKLLQKQNN
jgi:DNA-binding response OmpR family regulator